MTAPESRTTTTTTTTTTIRRGYRKRQTRDDGAKPSTGFQAVLPGFQTILPGFQAILPVFLLSAVTFSVLRYIVQPLFGSDEYYIDEQFHVPQARRYCRAAFHQWDPKITTLPGLYLLSAIVLVPGIQIYNSILSIIGVLDNYLLQDYDACSLIALRAVNAVGAPSCLYYAYYRCQQLLSQNENKKTLIVEWSNIILAMSVATFPVIYAPYSMLYYTDAWATASVFLWYSSHLSSKTNSWLKIVFGGFCVLCRQTNIAWLVFATIIDVCHCAEQCFPTVRNSGSTFSYIQACITELYKCCVVKRNNKFNILINFMKKCWYATYTNLIVIGSFALFVVFINKGDIVVGDRSAHIPRFHPMQLCYFVVFVLAFSSPWLLSLSYFERQISNSFVKRVKTSLIFLELQNNVSKVILITLVILMTLSVYFNTIAHPYLLADNRHYTFYAWRLLFGPNKPLFLRYLPIPLYACGIYYLDTTVTRSSIAYKLAFWIVTPLVLCPQYLLEPRYFVVPYLMYRLHTNRNNTKSTIKAAFFEFIAYQVCNFVIMWVFLYRPFISTMDKSGRLDRFTW